MSGLSGHSQEFGSFLSVIRVLWNGFKQYLLYISLWLPRGQERRQGNPAEMRQLPGDTLPPTGTPKRPYCPVVPSKHPPVGYSGPGPRPSTGTHLWPWERPVQMDLDEQACKQLIAR